LAFLPSEDIDNFSLRLASLMQKLEMFGDDDINEEQVVEKLLHIVPDKYTQVTLVVETILDLSALTIEVTGRLKAVDDRKLSLVEPTTTGGKLLLTEEQWRARQGEWKRGVASGSSSDRARRPRKKDKGKAPRPRGGDGSAADSERKANRDVICHNCSKTGHWAKTARGRSVAVRPTSTRLVPTVSRPCSRCMGVSSCAPLLCRPSPRSSTSTSRELTLSSGRAHATRRSMDGTSTPVRYPPHDQAARVLL
jgi:hypothetical protein